MLARPQVYDSDINGQQIVNIISLNALFQRLLMEVCGARELTLELGSKFTREACNETGRMRRSAAVPQGPRKVLFDMASHRISRFSLISSHESCIRVLEVESELNWKLYY
jgi:hypothetical protein